MKINYSQFSIFKTIILSTIFVFISSCEPGGDNASKGERGGSEVITGGIQEAVSVEIIGGTDLGEIVVGSEEKTISILIKNNSKFTVKDINLKFQEDSFMGLDFQGNAEGKKVFPGGEGTCKKDLKAKSQCTIKVIFNPNRSGEYSQEITISYTTLIDSESKSFSLSAKTGEAASLVFTLGTTFNNLGIYERTEPLLRTEKLKISNKGGLTARGIKTTLSSDASPNPFLISRNTCPLDLMVDEECEVEVSYISLNSKPFDLDKDYQGELKFTYERDADKNESNLISTFLFNSYQIQAIFETNTPLVQFTPNLIHGNKEAKTFKLTNAGYREGILSEAVFYKANGDLWAKCNKNVGVEVLECRNPSNAIAPLSEFPFVVKDIDNCLLAETIGGDVSTSGDSCFFELTFWPSLEHLSAQDYTGSTINFIYDTRYRGEENLKDVEFFTIEATTQTPAMIKVDQVSYNASNITNLGTDTIGLFDLERIALITNSAYSRTLTITIKNIGESIATINNIQDRDLNQITSVISDLNLYYKNAIHDCSVLGPGDTCKIDLEITPLFQNDSDIENDLMFDENPVAISSSLERFKNFQILYDDQAIFNDDGSLKADSVSHGNISAVLIQKGYLVYKNVNPEQADIGGVISGTTEKYKVILDNVGTGPIPYIKVDDVKNLTGGGIYPFEIIADAPGADADLDCFDIVDFDNSGLGVIPDALKQLPQGKSCALTIEYKVETTERMRSVDYAFEYLRAALVSENNTEDAWTHLGLSPADQYLSFHYYDGDISNSTPDLVNFGNFYELDDFLVGANFSNKAEIIPTTPTPLVGSIIYRPEIIFPTIIDGAKILNSETSSPLWINAEVEGSSFLPIVRSSQVLPFVSPKVNGSYEYTFHGGTFPSTGALTHKMTLNLESLGGSRAYINNISLSGGAGKFVLTGGGAIPADSVVMLPTTARPIEIEYTPTGSLEDECVLTVEYFNNLATVTKNIRIIAQGVIKDTNMPELELSYDDYQVTYDGSITSEVLKASITGTSLMYNTFDPGELIKFDAIRNSPVYAKKRFFITNTSTTSGLNNIEIDILESATSLTATNSGFGYSFLNKSNCAGQSLVAGGSCWFEIQFISTDALQPQIERFLNMSYNIGPNQFIAKQVKLQFNSEDPAELEVFGVNSEQVTDENALNRTSFPFDFKTFLQAGHIKVSSYPTTKTITKQVRNLTSLKASFLPMVNDIMPPGNPVEIYNQNDTIISATRACFYGDDEFDGLVPNEEKGFNVDTISLCEVNVTFEAYEKYVGDVIKVSDNVIPIEFYNNKRNSSDIIRFHLKGFIEPNGSTSDLSEYSGVTAESSGDVTLNWGSVSTDDSVWGSINGYRVFYTEFKNQLENIHDTSANYIDVGSSVDSVLIDSLIPGKYYYIKVVAKRNKGAVSYLSETNLGMLTVVVPPTGAIYLHDNFSVIDRDLLGDVGDRDEAFSFCGNEEFNILKNGSVEVFPKVPINSDVVNHLYTDPDSSNFSVYSNYNISVYSHHLSDAAVDIEPIFTPFGFASNQTNGAIPAEDLYYMKSCNNDSCNNLFKIVGGDGVLVPPGATLYSEGNIVGFIRCFSEMSN